MKAFFGAACFAALALTASGPAQSQTPRQFDAYTEVQMDGQPALKSQLTLLPGITPIILPASMWKCMVRAPRMAGTFASREVACWVDDSEEPGKIVAQVGTVATCEPGTVDVALLYLREGKRTLRVFLTCQ